MPNTVSYQVSKDLFLVNQQQAVDQAPKVAVEQPTNHFAVIDCSGSMYSDLPRIREQLKRKLPKLLKEQDTVSLIWFSGRGEFGTLLEGEPVATLTDLKAVEHAIDRWLKPCGLTGFTEPLQEAAKVVGRVVKKRPGSVSSLLFLSDGHDNQGTRASILKAMEEAAQGFQSTTVVEYGYYADRNLLSAMAEKAGGSHIFAEDFDRYAPTFEAVLQKRPTGAPRVEVKVEGDPIQGFVFAVQDGDLVTYAVEGGKVRVPENLPGFWFVSPRLEGVESMMKFAENVAWQVSKPNPQLAVNIRAAYAAVSLYAVRMKPNVVYPFLKVLGDVAFIEEFANCYGKQRYSAFQERAQKAAFGEGAFAKGYDPNKVPPDDAFTVLELLQLLANDDGNRVLLDDNRFRYSRIGRGRVDASEQLTDAEQEEVRQLTEEMGRTKKASRIAEITARITEISTKPAALKFEQDPAPVGYPISSLTFNEDRPNVSFLVKKTGTVDLSARLPSGSKVPARFKTHVFRNYTAIKDGLVNIDALPVNLTKGSYAALCEKLGQDVGRVFQVDYLTEGAVGAIGTLHLRELPVINRKMVQDCSAKDFFELQYGLIAAQAAQKVYNSYQKELAPKGRSEGLKELYGEDGAAWLKEQGITDGGFAPKSVQAESTDFYMGKELKTSIKGYSKLPSLKEAQAAIAKGKVNGPTSLMAPVIDEVEGFMVSASGKRAAVQVWLDVQAAAAKARTRELIFKIAQTTFTLVLGQIWFREFQSLADTSLEFEPTPGTKLEGKVEMREIECRI
jgi:von Willebrand factor type A domain